jgi:hypothetical protein
MKGSWVDIVRTRLTAIKWVADARMRHLGAWGGVGMYDREGKTVSGREAAEVQGLTKTFSAAALASLGHLVLFIRVIGMCCVPHSPPPSSPIHLA